MPLFIDVRGYFVDNKQSVFTFVEAGEMIKAGTLFRKGSMLEIGVGYKFFATSNIAVVGSVSGSFKGLSLTDERYKTADRTVVLRGIRCSLGFIF